MQNEYIKRGEMKWELLKGFWKDAGTFETLFEVNEYWRKKASKAR